MKRFCAATIAAAFVLGALPLSSAMAFESHNYRVKAYEWGGYGRPHGAPYARCPGNSAAEGNANQQTRPVKQYGQVSGGYRC